MIIQIHTNFTLINGEKKRMVSELEGVGAGETYIFTEKNHRKIYFSGFVDNRKVFSKNLNLIRKYLTHNVFVKK